MGAKLRWFDRTFRFDYPVEWYPDMIERMRGAPARVEDHVRRCSPDMLTRREGSGGWSIQENIGHLLSLEPLFEGRIDDYLAGLPELRAADVTNLATNQARYNERPIGEIVSRFRAGRERVVSRLESLSDADFERVSIHPRLKQPLRLVDAVCFVACHDDYHLARISELKRLWLGATRS